MLFFLFVSLLISLQTFGQLSERNANYFIDCVLDTANKQVQAHQVIVFNNNSDDTIYSMPFHMYYNAFRNNKTSFYLESNGSFGRKSEEDLKNGLWAWIKIDSIWDQQKELLNDSLSYVRYDDENPNDYSVIELQLKTPILPHTKISVELKWTSRIPKSGIRTGYNQDYYFMVQWFPKLGVYEPSGMRFSKKGQWNCHQYHANTEYYGEFGVYDVRLNVPADFLVGASGIERSTRLENDRKIVHYLAEDVIDFAWTASPRFVEISEQWNDIMIKLLVMPEHECNKERFLNTVKYSFNYLEEKLGSYPYPTFTVVSPPYYGLFSGAMEYPTLITAPTLCILPENIRTTETITMHELIHQYFMQMLATNEQEEAWMDEGFTAYYEAKMMDKFYPNGVFYWDYMNINISSKAYRRGRFFNSVNTKAGPLSQFGWLFKHGGHRELVYGKASIGLMTLEGLVGEECMNDIMRTYFQRWKFKHPCRHDFIDIVNEIVPRYTNIYGSDMNWYLDQLIYGTEECDYLIQSIDVRKEEENIGLFEDNSPVLLPSKKMDNYVSKVTIFRSGEFILPQDIYITLENGEVIQKFWDGKSRSYDIIHRGPNRIVSAELDPLNKYPLDKNLINNSYTIDPENSGSFRYLSSILSWFQTFLIILSCLI